MFIAPANIKSNQKHRIISSTQGAKFTLEKVIIMQLGVGTVCVKKPSAGTMGFTCNFH